MNVEKFNLEYYQQIERYGQLIMKSKRITKKKKEQLLNKLNEWF